MEKVENSGVKLISGKGEVFKGLFYYCFLLSYSDLGNALGNLLFGNVLNCFPHVEFVLPMMVAANDLSQSLSQCLCCIFPHLSSGGM